MTTPDTSRAPVPYSCTIGYSREASPYDVNQTHAQLVGRPLSPIGRAMRDGGESRRLVDQGTPLADGPRLPRCGEVPRREARFISWLARTSRVRAQHLQLGVGLGPRLRRVRGAVQRISRHHPTWSPLHLPMSTPSSPTSAAGRASPSSSSRPAGAFDSLCTGDGPNLYPAAVCWDPV